MGQFPEVTWPAEYTELTTIDELLHCKICYEYVETSVVTPCSHNYCSICIRKFLHYKTQCPACYVNVYEKDLHPNRIVDEILVSYLSLRAKLVTCIKGAEIKKNQTLVDKSPTLPATPNKPVKEEAISSAMISTPKTSHSGSRFTKLPRKTIGTPSTSDKTPKINALFGAKNVESGKKVDCPICGTEISETNINRHLDDCLKRQTSMSQPKTVKNNLEPLPKYVTNLMKDGELRKILKKYGLSTLGARKLLIKRLQRFSVLYNAERDKLAPKSLCDIVKQCEMEETTENNVMKLNSSDYGPVIDRKTDVSVIEKMRKQYLEKNKDDYQKLIEKVKQREKADKNPAESVFAQIDEDTVATTSSASQETSHNVSERQNSSEMDVNQYYPSDTDSSATCPLQHYSKEDPMRFLALEITSDSHSSPTKMNECSPPKREREKISGASLGSRSSLEKPVSSPRSAPSSTSNENSAFQFAQIVASESKSDIFDASTEDNWSESNCNSNVNSTSNRAKRLSRKVRVKQSKRTKIWSGNGSSSDSETDVDIRPRSAGRKTSGIQKPRGKEPGIDMAGPKDNNGNLSPESTTTSCIGIIADPKTDKENFEALAAIAASGGETSARRSCRNRNPISYVYNPRNGARASKKKKKADQVLEEQRVNLVDSPATGDRESEGGTNDSVKKPSRKRRKTVKQ